MKREFRPCASSTYSGPRRASSRILRSGEVWCAAPWWVLAALVFLTLAGCRREEARFEPNLVYFRVHKLLEDAEDVQSQEVQQRIQDTQRVLALFFGTPDQPRLPALEGMELDSILELEMLRMAAGSGEDSQPGYETGLYRRMCARCHGISGSGTGPEAARLDPYPRDYRRGIFKFKHTPSTLPPTDADLHDVLVRGVPGTPMPTFRLLRAVEREALVQYVRYLSIRGMFERALIEEAAFELDSDQWLLDPTLRESTRAYADQMRVLEEIAAEVMRPWLETESLVLQVPPPPEDYGTRRSVLRGREMFFTTLTNCGTCHGTMALGDGQTEDEYDEWTKELDPANAGAVKQFLALGALPPRIVRPRSLREGLYHGGHRAEDLFLKVKYGIAGTTMPTIAAQLSDDDVWHLVAYARYLPFDPLNRPATDDQP